jgi:hypothetical protein
MESFLSKNPSPCYKSKGKFVIDMKLNFFTAASIAALLAITAPFQRASGQTKSNSDPAPVKTTEAAYAKNTNTTVKESKIDFAKNANDVSDTTKGEPLSPDQQAKEYSKNWTGIGYVLSVGKDNTLKPEDVARSLRIKTNKAATGFGWEGKVDSKVFMDEFLGKGMEVTVFINGYRGKTYSLNEIQKEIPDLTSVQIGGLLEKQKATADISLTQQ